MLYFFITNIVVVFFLFLHPPFFFTWKYINQIKKRQQETEFRIGFPFFKSKRKKVSMFISFKVNISFQLLWFLLTISFFYLLLSRIHNQIDHLDDCHKCLTVSMRMCEQNKKWISVYSYLPSPSGSLQIICHHHTAGF